MRFCAAETAATIDILEKRSAGLPWFAGATYVNLRTAKGHPATRD